MKTVNESTTDPKITPDSFSGVETDNQITNSEEQNIINNDTQDKNNDPEKKAPEIELPITEKERIETSMND